MSESPHSHRQLGRYELVHRIEVGGMAEIFLAIERGKLGFERLVVIKRALPHLAEAPHFREMFLQEARFVARITHPNIVQIHELGEVEGTAFIAMEHVLGITFRDLVRKALRVEQPFPLGVVVGLIAQACAGAHAAHELTDPQGNPLGLVHRDISPHNLMVTAGGHVKLLDFGIAKATELGKESTRSGALKGKLHYMSPEQLLQRRLDRKSDVFALGIVSWELLTLKRLYKRENDMATMRAIIESKAWNPRDFRPDVPEAVARAVLKALDTDPKERFATADAFRRALVEAADAAGLRHDIDAITAHVDSLVGEALKAHEAAVMEAVERAKTQGFDEEGGHTDIDAARGIPLASTDTLPRAFGGEEVTASQMPAPEPAAVETLPAAEALPEPPRPKLLVPPSLVRRAVALALVALVVGGGAAWWLSRSTLHGPVQRMGWAPTIDPAVLAEEVEPMRVFLEEKTHHPVEFVYTKSYGELAEQLLDGGVEFASMPAALLVRTERRDPRVRPLALKLIGGSAGTDGVLLAVEGSNIATVADLKGKRVCVPDEQSTTGMLLPRFAARRAGVNWEQDVTVVHSGNHLQVLRDLTERKCDAGGTYQGAYVNAVTQGVDVSALRQIAVTGHSPQDSIVAGPAASDKEAKALQQALYSFKPAAAPGQEQSAFERISGFVPVKPEDFAALREMIAAEESPPK